MKNLAPIFFVTTLLFSVAIGCGESSDLLENAAQPAQVPEPLGWAEVFHNRDCAADICLQQGGLHVSAAGSIGYGPATGPVTDSGRILEPEEAATLFSAANRVAAQSLPGTLYCDTWSDAPKDASVLVRITLGTPDEPLASRLIYSLDAPSQERCTHGLAQTAQTLFEEMQKLSLKYLPQ
jgi:hypothetical protein